MKKLALILLSVSLLSGLIACNAFQEKVVYGKLTTKANSGWDAIPLYDEDGKAFQLRPGNYTLNFGLSYPFFDPKITIKNANGQVMGVIKIPKEKIKSDGTFEMYVGDSKNSVHTNVLGGRREVVLSRQRYAVIRQHCTYTVTEACTDVNGNLTTCTRTESGNQDAVKEKRRVMSLYKILFDGSDMVNAGMFEGQSDTRIEDVQLASTSCS